MTMTASAALAVVSPVAANSFADIAQRLVTVAEAILLHPEAGCAIDVRVLRLAMEQAFGASDAEGAWDWKLAYDACEAAQILFLRKYANAIFRKSASASDHLALIEKIAALMSTHIHLAEGHMLKQVRAMGVPRVELTGFNDLGVDRLKAIELISEIVSWKLRLFVPTGAGGPEVVGRLMERYPLVRVAERIAGRAA